MTRISNEMKHILFVFRWVQKIIIYSCLQCLQFNTNLVPNCHINYLEQDSNNYVVEFPIYEINNSFNTTKNKPLSLCILRLQENKRECYKQKKNPDIIQSYIITTYYELPKCLYLYIS